MPSPKAEGHWPHPSPDLLLGAVEVEAAGSYLLPGCAPGFLHPLLWFQHLCVALGASYLVHALQIRLVIEDSLPLTQTSFFFFSMPAITGFAGHMISV